jgi:hypothetical protein
MGCSGFQVVGPLAKHFGPVKSLPPEAAATEPITVPAVKPTPPLSIVTPDEVERDPYLAAQKLTTEFETDRGTISKAPVTAEVSRYKGGVK